MWHLHNRLADHHNTSIIMHTTLASKWWTEVVMCYCAMTYKLTYSSAIV